MERMAQGRIDSVFAALDLLTLHKILVITQGALKQAL
jgi:hypothetical protein